MIIFGIDPAGSGEATAEIRQSLGERFGDLDPSKQARHGGLRLSLPYVQ